MNPVERMTVWLERHWATPSYGGWLLAFLSAFFFGAATNTMAGWLYVMSGVIAALLLVSAIVPGRTLRQLRISRSPIAPVSTGDPLLIEVQVENPTSRAKPLIQIQDQLPKSLAKEPVQTSIEFIPPRTTHQWLYRQPTLKRGVYRWQNLELRTGNPFGLFWSRRDRDVKAKAIVYPTVLPLNSCPLVDEIGREEDPRFPSAIRSQTSTEGLTRALRPYRWGDPTRLIHWRTSARYGELRVRELEVFTGGQELVIALDSAASWNLDYFEQAVIAAVSLYFYSLRQRQSVQVWTAGTDLLRGDRQVLEALAETQAKEPLKADLPPDLPLIWLTQNSTSLTTLPTGSRWALWPTIAPSSATPGDPIASRGLIVIPDAPLQPQLQGPLQ
ncbi:MAG: DUF58 domain-containing protein [Leptolyngbyaceae cyanobacterium bins.59]|nr:DUF58 domain-containing protein [Leptolyngbyaceae cyanobacterium bins.59]